MPHPTTQPKRRTRGRPPCRGRGPARRRRKRPSSRRGHAPRPSVRDPFPARRPLSCSLAAWRPLPPARSLCLLPSRLCPQRLSRLHPSLLKSREHSAAGPPSYGQRDCVAPLRRPSPARHGWCGSPSASPSSSLPAAPPPNQIRDQEKSPS
jgi:hypothetical protein